MVAGKVSDDIVEIDRQVVFIDRKMLIAVDFLLPAIAELGKA